MKYKDLQNKVHEIEPAFAHLLPAGCVQITDTEAVALLVPILTLQQKRDAKWLLIKAKRDDLQLNGGVKVGLNWFLTTDRAVGEYTSLALISTGLPDTTILRAGWRTMNGVLIDMTPLLVKQILSAGFTQIAAIDTVSQNHKAAMELSATPEAYDFSAGWPVVYIP